MGSTTDDIEVTKSVSSSGVDSLLAVELRSWNYAAMQADVSVFDLLGNILISSLARKIVLASKVVPGGVIAFDLTHSRNWNRSPYCQCSIFEVKRRKTLKPLACVKG
jgi:hypothetical protein